MSPSEAAAAVGETVRLKVEDTIQKRNSKLVRASNALRNAELDVLRGNPSPSPPGSPPGVRSGTLMRSWVPYQSAGGTTAIFGIICGAHYAGYLEHGTSKMAARPFVEKIKQKAMPREGQLTVTGKYGCLRNNEKKHNLVGVSMGFVR